MVNFGEKSSKITVFSDDFSPKLTKVRPKSVSWRSNQEWPSICADTVYNFGIDITFAATLAPYYVCMYLPYPRK